MPILRLLDPPEEVIDLGCLGYSVDRLLSAVRWRRHKLSALMLLSATFGFGYALALTSAFEAHPLVRRVCAANLISSVFFHFLNLYMDGDPVGAPGVICCWWDRLTVAITVLWGGFLMWQQENFESMAAGVLVPVLFAFKATLPRDERLLRSIVHTFMHQIGIGALFPTLRTRSHRTYTLSACICSGVGVGRLASAAGGNGGVAAVVVEMGRVLDALDNDGPACAIQDGLGGYLRCQGEGGLDLALTVYRRDESMPGRAGSQLQHIHNIIHNMTRTKDSTPQSSAVHKTAKAAGNGSQVYIQSTVSDWLHPLRIGPCRQQSSSRCDHGRGRLDLEFFVF